MIENGWSLSLQITCSAWGQTKVCEDVFRELRDRETRDTTNANLSMPSYYAFLGNMGTITAHCHGQEWAEGPKRSTGSIWRSIRLFARGSVTSVRHVKAHRALADIDASDPQAIVELHGNYHADLLAKKANFLQPDLGEQALALRRKSFDLKMVALHIGKAISLFPSFRGQTARASFVKLTPRTAGRLLDDKHNTTWFGSLWLCIKCGILSLKQFYHQSALL